MSVGMPIASVSAPGHTTTCDWPGGTYVQGGAEGLVVVKDGDNYLAPYFFEAFPPGHFVRGEGNTMQQAEERAWAKWEEKKNEPAQP